MAHSPISQPDPLDPQEPGYAPVVSPLEQWVSILSECGGEGLAADLALDLVLHDIVERARVTTQSTAAAIALTRDGQIVCRATTGENAPDLGVPLNTRSGLSAACVESRQWQRCDDAESDPRVDKEICRRLGVRSMLVFPVLKEQELLGIIEIFASRPQAFGDRDIETLETLAREVVESVERAAGIHSAIMAPQPAAQDPSLGSLKPKAPRSEEHDYLTNALSLLVLVLAVILGWVMGRAGWRNAMGNSSARRQISQSQPAPAVTPATNQQMAQESAGQSATATPGGDAVTGNGLVIYQDGKEVFHTPSRASHQDTSRAAGTVVQPAAKISGGMVPALRIPPQVAKGYVVKRVEPEYPEQARAQHIQGSVVMGVVVDKNGVVEKLTTMSGDPQLAAAAAEAVRQWRFQPFFRNGQPEEFQTRITVVFRLP